MKNIDDLIFIDRLPSIDLHGFDSETAGVYIKDFINENLKLSNEFFVIVHGLGSGILRKKTHEILNRDRNVLDFKTYYFNNGCTIVQLNLAKK